MKYIAKQVPPEEQGNPMDFYVNFSDYMEYEFPGVILTGNNDFNKYGTDAFWRVYDALEYTELFDVIKHWKDMKGYYKNITDAIMTHLWPENKKKYSTREIRRLKELIVDYQYCSCRDEDDIICKVLEIVTGHKYANCTIRGCVQGEWQEVYYPCDQYDRYDLNRLEADYFGYVDQWEVYDENDQYLFNCFTYSNDLNRIKNEIEQALPCGVTCVELQVITGYSYQKIVNYETA